MCAVWLGGGSETLILRKTVEILAHVPALSGIYRPLVKS